MLALAPYCLRLCLLTSVLVLDVTTSTDGCCVHLLLYSVARWWGLSCSISLHVL